MSQSQKPWQHPFVNVTKYAKSNTQLGIKTVGNVQEIIDRTHGKPCYYINGSISANNFVQIPSVSSDSGLELTGSLLYLQLCVDGAPVPSEPILIDNTSTQKSALDQSQQKKKKQQAKQQEQLQQQTQQQPRQIFYVFHIDVVTRDDLTIRLSFSNLYKSLKVQSKFAYIPIGDVLDSDRWTVLALDLNRILVDFFGRSFRQVKSLAFCSTMKFRNAFTSDLLYTDKNLPRDMYLTVPKGKSWNDLYEWRWFPMQPDAPLAQASYFGSDAGVQNASQTGMSFMSQSTITAPPRIHQDDISTYMAVSRQPGSQPVPVVEQTEIASAKRKASIEQQQLRPDPILSCRHIVGYSGKYSSNVTWSADGRVLVYSCFNQVVVMDMKTRTQRILQGHTAPICGLALDDKGVLLVSAQEGKDPIVRVWHVESGRCVGFLHGHQRDLCCIDISFNGNSVAVVGLDENAKNKIVIWDISQILETGKALMLVKKSTLYHFNKLRFVPNDDSRMVSCGKDSIRFWRIKSGQLRDAGLESVDAAEQNKELLRQNFLGIAFERAFLGTGGAHDAHTLYVSTQSGAVFEISYKNRVIENVYQLHNGAIHTIDVNEGMVVTGSDDCFVRVWPMDFQDFFLEARHDSPVRSAKLSQDGLSIAIGTLNGSLGALDMTNQRYTTLVRSHTSTVTSIAMDNTHNQFATVGTDNTIRVWDMGSLEQLYQFDTVGETPVSVVYHPHEQRIAVGFSSGVIRIFDVSGTTLLHELRAHRTAVQDLVYTHDSRWLISASGDSMCVLDCDHMYQPVKVMHYLSQSKTVCLALSPDGSLLASIGPSGNIVHIYSTRTFDEAYTFETASSDSFLQVRFSHDARSIIASTTDSRVLKIDIVTGKVIREQIIPKDVSLTSLEVSSNGLYLVAGCSDASVKVLKADLQYARAMQTFSGHSKRVNRVCISNDKQTILSVGDDALVLWQFFGDIESDISTEIDNYITRKTQQAANDTTDSDSLATPDFVGLIDQIQRANALPSVEQEEATPNSDQERIECITIVPVLHGDGNGMADVVAPRNSAQPLLRKEALQLAHVAGFDGLDNAQNLVINHKDSNLYYSSANLLIVQDTVRSGKQKIIQLEEEIAHIALSGDGSLVAVACRKTDLPQQQEQAEDSSALSVAPIYILEATPGNIKNRLALHEFGVRSISFSPCGRFLASLGEQPENSLFIWDIGSGSLIASADCHSEITYQVLWLPQELVHAIESDGQLLEDEDIAIIDRCRRQLVTVGRNTVLFWLLDLSVLEEHGTSQLLMKEMNKASMDSMREMLSTGSTRTRRQGRKKEQQQLHAELEQQLANLVVDFTCAEFTHFGDDHTLWLGTGHGWIFGYDAQQGVLNHTWKKAHVDAGIKTIRSHNSNFITCGTNEQLKRWRMDLSSDGSYKFHLGNEHALDGPIAAVSLRQSGESGFVSTQRGTIFCLDWPREFMIKVSATHNQMVTGLAHGFEQGLLVSSSRDGSVLLHHTTPEHSLSLLHQWLPSSQYGENTGISVNCLALNHSSLILAAGDSLGRVHLFDTAKLQARPALQAFQSGSSVRVNGVAITRDDRHVIVAGSDGTIVICDIGGKILLQERRLSDMDHTQIGTVTQLIVSPHDENDTLFALCTDSGTISVWRLRSLLGSEQVKCWHVHTLDIRSEQERQERKRIPICARFDKHHQGRNVLMYSDVTRGRLVFYDFVKKAQVRSVPLRMVSQGHIMEFSPSSFDISPQCDYIAVGTFSSQVVIADYAGDRGIMQVFEGNADVVTQVAFDETGQRLFSGSKHGDVCMWNASHSLSEAVLAQHKKE